MIQIRKGLFETNSSSCHAVVICKEGSPRLDDAMYAVKGRIVEDKHGNKKILYHNLCYDGGYEYMPSWVDKLGYVIAQKWYDGERLGEEIERCLDMVRGHFPDITAIELENCHDYESIDDTGFRIVVNHQSGDFLEEFLSKENIYTEEFVFNPRYILFTAWDSAEPTYFVDEVKKDRITAVKVIDTFSSYTVDDKGECHNVNGDPYESEYAEDEWL